MNPLEVDRRYQNGVRAHIAAARFPVIKTIESFDFSLQAQLPKSEAARAVGWHVCFRQHTAKYRVLFTTAAELRMNLIMLNVRID